jgi:hypothetical protein
MNMKRVIFILCLLPGVAFAGEAKPLTVGQCLDVMAGLNALNYVGQQLGDQQSKPPDAKAYKLGPARMTIALDIAALRPISDAAEKTRQGIVTEISGGKPIQAGTDEMKQYLAKWQKVLDGPCGVAPGHLRAADLKIGDGADENPIPPSVLSVLIPIIDQ